MEHCYGRLLDHVHLKVADLESSRRFYRAVLAALGKSLSGNDQACWCDELYLDQGPASRVHLAFQAQSHEQVRAFYRAALAAGGTSNGEPGERPYHPGYFAAFVRDPDGNNVEAVYHGPSERSAEAVWVHRS
ncbi:VOC family protein [Gallaecimonas sp. GXIMD4217]|uniref:VOC family protein n=1 Tax=Gallaecimonas sp. GXIMD4217 TaxID=3131927 RepID=UPI00311B0325